MNMIRYIGRLVTAVVLVALMASLACADDARVFRASDRSKPGVPSLSGKELAQLRDALASANQAKQKNIWFGFVNDDGHDKFIIFDTRGYPVDGRDPYGAAFEVLNDDCMVYIPRNHDIEWYPRMFSKCMQ